MPAAGNRSRSPCMAWAVKANRQVLACRSFSLPNSCGCREAVHLRHMNVHEDDVYSGRIQHCRRLAAVGRYRDIVLALAQHCAGHGLIDGVVVCNQDEQGARCMCRRDHAITRKLQFSGEAVWRAFMTALSSSDCPMGLRR
jgi:hypothetical protein